VRARAIFTHHNEQVYLIFSQNTIISILMYHWLRVGYLVVFNYIKTAYDFYVKLRISIEI